MKNKTIITALTVIIASLITYFFVSIKKEYPQLYNIENDVISSVNKVNGLKIIPKIENLENEKIKILTFNKVSNSISNAVNMQIIYGKTKAII